MQSEGFMHAPYIALIRTYSLLNAFHTKHGNHGSLMNVLCTFNLRRPVSRGLETNLH